MKSLFIDLVRETFYSESNSMHETPALIVMKTKSFKTKLEMLLIICLDSDREGIVQT